MPREINPCNKEVKPDQAYEVWRVTDHPQFGGTWTWYVLRKYQSPSNEIRNPHARWMCAVHSPLTEPRMDYGDVYISDILLAGAYRLDCNPLAIKYTDEQTT